ncbi:MAG: NAD(+) synthase [Lachnospiraceae bacterium]
MFDGFVRAAAASPDLKVADCTFNTQKIEEVMQEAYRQHVSVLVFPELCITGYTCSDLFLQESLQKAAWESLLQLEKSSSGMKMVTAVGLPVAYEGSLYNAAAVLYDGAILGIVPKTHIPNYSEFYEARHFASGMPYTVLKTEGREIPFGTDLLFCCRQIPELRIGIEICEDLWVPLPPGTKLALSGATLLANLSASDEVVGKASYRRDLVKSQSARLICGYIYADAGEGESTTDMIFAGHDLICENGTVLAESKRFENGMIAADLDVRKLSTERIRTTTWQRRQDLSMHEIEFDMQPAEYKLTRRFAKHPFVPDDAGDRAHRCEEIFTMQAVGLKTRLAHIGCRHAVIGISGGLDSTLALLVTVRAFDMLGLDRSNIIAVTMPCFGTTDRTYNNACELVRRLGAGFREVNISEAVKLHFRDIGQDPEKHDVTYENCQARERTQVIMDIANMNGGIVVGTGDLSELALGWATYNGDHMSMYGVNASIPKTLVRHLVRYAADTADSSELREILLDILDTPVSPELIPPKDGVISQQTEDIVGPYELHDFFLYYMLRFGMPPGKIYRMALQTFEGDYSRETILKWLRTFYRRFFAQQFKRSCLPDGPKVGTVTVSPRGDWRMPSDACAAVWLKEIDELN